MARLNFLDRFRPVGAPGAARGTGRAEEVRGPATELAPVFAALAPDLESARTLVVDAQRSAEKMVAEARARAAAVTAQARLDAVTVRAQAAAAVEKASTARDRRLLARAHREASSVEARAEVELAAAAQRVIERMVEDLLHNGNSSSSRATG